MSERAPQAAQRFVSASVGVLGLVAFFALPDPAFAHTRSSSYSKWALDESGATVEFRMQLLEMTRVPPDHPWPEYLVSHLQLRTGEVPCEAGTARRAAHAPEGWAVFRWTVRCDSSSDAKTRSLASNVFQDVVSAHTHFARVISAQPPLDSLNVASSIAAPIRERVLVTGQDPPWVLDRPDGEDSAGTSLFGYLSLGVQHILEGWDHLAFVFALLLLATTLREVLTLVTAFTLAHSLTLGLAVFGVLRPDWGAVEILIGFSIALVAAENSWLLAGRGRAIPGVFVAALTLGLGLSLTGSGHLGALAWLGLALFSACHFGLLGMTDRPARLRAAVAFAFGLVHGFGFAGVLMEIELPVDRMLPALFGFNLGVEIGQLAVVVCVWPALLWLATGHVLKYRLLAETGSASVFGLGLFWFVTRTWG